MTTKRAFTQSWEDERCYLELLGLDPLDRFLFGEIRRFTDNATGVMGYSLSTLSARSGIGVRRVQNGLKTLATHGLIERTRGTPVHGGPRGLAFQWRTRITPIETWPIGPVAAALIAIPAYVGVFYGAKNTHDVRDLPTKNTHRTTEEHAQNDRRTRTATRHSPDVSQESLSRVVATTSKDEEDATSARRVSKALDELRDIEGYDFDEGRDRAMLLEVASQSPGVPLVREIRAWGERGFSAARNPRAALRAWLRKGRPGPDVAPAEPPCVRCNSDRGRGPERLCMKCRGLKVA